MQMGKETTAGTPVAATKIWYPNGTGLVDIDSMLSLHRGNRGTRTAFAYATSKGTMVKLGFASNPEYGMTFDEMITPLSQICAPGTATAAGAAYTWSIAPSQTGANAAGSAYTIEYTDDIQEYEVEYCQASDFTISASEDSMTNLAVNWFGRQSTKSTKTSLIATNPPRIPGELWKPTWFTTMAGLGTAAASTNSLIDWSLQVNTGLVPQFYQDGLGYFGEAVQSQELSGTITFHVVSNAFAVSEFYDKWNPGGSPTMDFMQLKAVGPALGGSNYSATIQMALLYTQVKPISAETNGVNIYEVTGELAYDSTSSQSIQGTAICSFGTVT
jgi:hypothetical protein